MDSYKKMTNIAGWLVFAIAMTVYFFSVERTGSLWDCGEFITGAHKLQVVHPPGAALFLLIGRMFTFVADVLSDNPADIAFSINLLSGLCTAFAAAFICWVTIMLGKLTMMRREDVPTTGQSIALAGAGLVAGLASAFASSIWFSAVEGEVYAMSTFFTALTFWSMIKWYSLPDTPQADRWIIFAVYSAGLSTGVHLLSLLTFPVLAMFYYFKKKPSTSSVLKLTGFAFAFIVFLSIVGKAAGAASGLITLLSLGGLIYYFTTSNIRFNDPTSNEEKEITLLGSAGAALMGVSIIYFIQTFIIIGIPQLWSWLEVQMVNTLGMPFDSGLIPLALLFIGLFYYLFHMAVKKNSQVLQNLAIAGYLLVISFSTIGVVVIRAGANTPINMNDPSDPLRLIPYLNREQYGERPLLKGPNFTARPVDIKSTDRMGRVEGLEGEDKYEIVDEKNEYIFDPKDETFFPRQSHTDRKALYEEWNGHKGAPTFGDNFSYFFRYQVGWMYWRYFLWNFAGRQNGEQGFNPWDKSSGHWLSGLSFIDNNRLFDQSNIPETMANNKARNKYFLLPLIFGLLGIFFQIKRRNNDFLALLGLFIITGIGIIVYSNQPPNEPRERDYVLAGSIFTYCIWIGMGVLAIFNFIREKGWMPGTASAVLAAGLVLTAPLIMSMQNFDDHTRRHHSGARDYASNFLNSCEKNSIIFTYGDNDTYPLWYAQEIEGIRTDVRVVNLSLIAVDWYINQLRRKVNQSEAIKMTIPREAYRGKKRVQNFYIKSSAGDREKRLIDVVRFLGEDHNPRLPAGTTSRELDSYFDTKNVYIPVNKQRVLSNGTVTQADTAKIVDKVSINIPKNSLLKGELAVLDIIASNAFERPIYFAVTCRPESLLGFDDYLQLEGLGLRFVPVKTKGDGRLGMVGKGRTNVDALYDNVMNKFRWGNFDKMDLFVDRSYGPSVQTQKVAIMRGIEELVKNKDFDRAVSLTDKYFEAFPHMNFPYDSQTMYYLKYYQQAGAIEKALPHLEILAKELDDWLDFYDSLDREFIFSQWLSDIYQALRAASEIQDLVKDQDESLQNKYKDMFEPYQRLESDLQDYLRRDQERRRNGAGPG